MSLFVLVRHASALSREEWNGDDDLRPLNAQGRRQAEWLVDALAGRTLDRIVSSPAVRCVDTVRSLAEVRGLDLEEREELAEGASRCAIFALLDELDESGFLLCTHGDVVYELLGEGMKKGEVRVLVRTGDRIRTVG